MNLQTVIRAVVCAAIVAICIAGAGWFATRPVAGQETKHHGLQGAAALDQLKRDGQFDSLQAAMNQARFGVSHAEATPLGRAAWHAPNPAAGYDAYVTEEGVSIALNDKTYVSLSLHSLGYGHALRSVAPGAVSGDKQKINITREDVVREWFVNGPDGLEHGFTLSEPPGVQGQGAPLRLTLQVSKGWRAVAGEDGQRVILRGGDDQAVEYGKLVVLDSQGRNIAARLAVTNEQVVIEVEDGEATYPLTIDPIFGVQQKLLAATWAANDCFGYRVALDGDTLVVGAPCANWGQGSVYVFTRNGATWTQQQKLIADDGAAGDSFGSTVTLDGDTLAVGAEWDGIGANAYQGSAYVFTRSGATWTQQQKLIADDGAYGDNFGTAVAVNGDTLVVGANRATIGANIDQGSVYVFTRSGATWTQQQKLIANDGAVYENFGQAVALKGDTLVVGVQWDDIGANGSQGSAYVFTRSGATWILQQKLIANDGAESDNFGFAVSLDGDTLAVGARSATIGANWEQGSAYVFTRSGAMWTQQQKLIANDGAVGDFFGYAVALDGDLLVVGASNDDNGANANQGSAYVFTLSGSTWTQQQKLIANDGAKDDGFGIAVALSGHTFVVGSAGDDIGVNLDQGSAYVFTHSITISPSKPLYGSYGEPFSVTFTATGGVGPYTFSMKGMPPVLGLRLSPDGVLSGAPRDVGTIYFTVEARDAYGCIGSRRTHLTIAPPD